MQFRKASTAHENYFAQFLAARSGEGGHSLESLDLQYADLKPRDVVAAPGDHHEHVYVVMSGLLRLYVHPKAGEQRAITFYGPHQMVAHFASLRPLWKYFGRDGYLAAMVRDRGNRESEFGVDAAAPSTVLRLPVEQLATKADQDLKWAKVAVHQASLTTVLLEQHMLDLLLLSRDEHYLKILRKLPSLERTIKSRDLASLLGITPETLSRIRARVRSQRGS